MCGNLLECGLLVYVVLVGACLGSFVNVVIARLPQGMSVIRPGSRCPKCNTPIRWYDNVPVLSYLLLRGRCRSCNTEIAARYMLIEAAMACLACALYVRFGATLDLLFWLPLTAALLAITFLDIDYFWVPDVIVLPATALAVLYVFRPGGDGSLTTLLGLIPAALLLAVALGFKWVLGKEGLGFGDIKLLALLGLLVGPMQSLSLLLLATVQGAVIGSLVVWRGGHVSKPLGADDDWQPPPRAIPFGPFLVLATLEVVLLPDVFGQGIVHAARWILTI